MRKRGQEHMKHYLSQIGGFSEEQFPLLTEIIVQPEEKSIELQRIYEIKAKFSLQKGEAYLILLSTLLESDKGFQEIMEGELHMDLAVAEDIFQKNYPEAVFSIRKGVLKDGIFMDLEDRLRLEPRVLEYILEGGEIEELCNFIGK